MTNTGRSQWSHQQYRSWTDCGRGVPVQKLARQPGQVSYHEVTGLPLDPELVADAIKEELMFMRKQVYHEVPAS